MEWNLLNTNTLAVALGMTNLLSNGKLQMDQHFPVVRVASLLHNSIMANEQCNSSLWFIDPKRLTMMQG